MSISKAISLDFSDGTNTVYSRTSTVNIPFEVMLIRVANSYMEITGAGGQAMNGIITSNLVDNEVLAITREYTSTKPIKHYFDIPRPINGSYNFSINVSNTLYDFSTTSRVGFELTGTIDIAVNPNLLIIDLASADNAFITDPTGFDSVIGKLIKTGLGTTFGLDKFTIISYNTSTGFVVITETATINQTAQTFRIESNLLTITAGSDTRIQAGSFINATTDTITLRTSSSRFRLNRSYYSASGIILINSPGVFKYNDLTKCEVLLDLEFYDKIPIPRQIENQQYFLWNSTSLSDIKNVDILFPVDELQIVNTDCLTDNVYDIYGFGSDLISSSTLYNENFLAFNVLQSSIYQVNKKKWVFNQPKIFSGAYKIFAKTMLTNVAFDLAAVNGEFYIHFLFIQYKK